MIWLWLAISLTGLGLTGLVIVMVRMVGARETAVIWFQIICALVFILIIAFLYAKGMAEIST